MAMQPIYLVATKNLSAFLEALRHAQTPSKVSLRFLEELGFKSTNDRLFIPLLKALRFLDESAKPTERYHAFLDDNEWKSVLADGIREAYSDLFRINRNAHTLTRESLTGKLRSLGEGKFSASVLTNMTKTFLELVKLADFSEKPIPSGNLDIEDEQVEMMQDSDRTSHEPRVAFHSSEKDSSTRPSLVYRIEIVLPAVRDQAVYDAIFKSVREHLSWT